MPGKRPSALGAATNVRIGVDFVGMSAYSVVTIILSATFITEMGGDVNAFVGVPVAGFEIAPLRAARVRCCKDIQVQCTP